MKRIFLALVVGATMLYPLQGQESLSPNELTGNDVSRNEMETINEQTGLSDPQGAPLTKPDKPIVPGQPIEPELPSDPEEPITTAQPGDLNQPNEPQQPTESPFTSVAAMVKQVLGEVYTEVGHIPEPQWFEMEPIAETYVKALFQARKMTDDEAATQLVQNARTTFNVGINAILTGEQKSARTQKTAEIATKMTQAREVFISKRDSIGVEMERMKSNNNQQPIQIVLE